MEDLNDQDARLLLVRLHERLTALMGAFDKEFDSLRTQIKSNREETKRDFAELKADMKTQDSQVQSQIDKLYEELEKNYTKRESFNPIQKLVYGLVCLILTGFVGAILGLVLKAG